MSLDVRPANGCPLLGGPLFGALVRSMDFVSELIESEENFSRFNAMGLKDPFANKPARARRWIIDKDTGDFLVALGGGEKSTLISRRILL